jgi:hypothetical protein
MYKAAETFKRGLEPDFIPDHLESKESIFGTIKSANKPV